LYGLKGFFAVVRELVESACIEVDEGVEFFEVVVKVAVAVYV
jgi:hypothetical protein